MNNIKIVNDELRKRTDKNIVFDYDGKTFFYEGSEYYDHIKIYYEDKIVFSYANQKYDWEEIEYFISLQINKRIITRELFSELKEMNLINDLDYDDACDIGFDIFEYYTKKYSDIPNADLEKTLRLNSKYMKEFVFMFKINNEYYFGNITIRNADWLIKDLSLVKYDKNLNKEFVLEFDSHAWEDKLIYGYYYYNDNLLTNEIKIMLENAFDISFESEKIKKYILKINSLHADNLHLDLVYQNKQYLIRKIPVQKPIPTLCNEIKYFRYKIFDSDYNLLYEELPLNEFNESVDLPHDYYWGKQICNYKKALYLNGFIEIFESVSYLKEIGYNDVKTRIDKCFSDENKYPELQ
jgi:hypothetical protein